MDFHQTYIDIKESWFGIADIPISSIFNTSYLPTTGCGRQIRHKKKKKN